jgi:hypothetical protein
LVGGDPALVVVDPELLQATSTQSMIQRNIPVRHRRDTITIPFNALANNAHIFIKKP